MKFSEIRIWGDSVAKGIFFNEEKQRYALSSSRCTDLLEEKTGVSVYNHAVMGATAADGLKAFLQRPASPNALCAIEYGGNDCDLDWAYVAQHPEEMVQAREPLANYGETLRQWVEAVRERDMEPVLVTPPPLHAERYFGWVSQNLNAEAILSALHGDVCSIYRWQERYAVTMRNIATQTRCMLWDLRDVFLARLDYPALMCVDGIHPNEAGYRVIAESVLAAVTG